MVMTTFFPNLIHAYEETPVYTNNRSAVSVLSATTAHESRNTLPTEGWHCAIVTWKSVTPSGLRRLDGTLENSILSQNTMSVQTPNLEVVHKRDYTWTFSYYGRMSSSSGQKDFVGGAMCLPMYPSKTCFPAPWRGLPKHACIKTKTGSFVYFIGRRDFIWTLLVI